MADDKRTRTQTGAEETIEYLRSTPIPGYFRDDGTQDEELSGIPNGFREHVEKVARGEADIETLQPNWAYIRRTGSTFLDRTVTGRATAAPSGAPQWLAESGGKALGCNQSLGTHVDWKCKLGTVGCTAPHDGKAKEVTILGIVEEGECDYCGREKSVVRLAIGKMICADCFYQQRDTPKR